MNNPELTEKIEALVYYLKFDGALPREIYQFTVLYVAMACGADFEWQDHVAHARAAGIPVAVIEAIHIRSGIVVEPYATALPVIEAAFKWQDVSQSAQDTAIARFGVKAYVELVVVTGFYQMFSGINQGFAVSA
jgi:4-carboxymuconolactone decarboxylase